MKSSNLLLVIILAVAASATTTWFIKDKSAPTAAVTTAYDRVRASGTLRCGYYVWPPYLNKDPNTGAVTGLYHDYVEKLGSWLNLKILWAEEVGYGDLVTALENHRIDAFCGLLWPNSPRAQKIDFTAPFFYLPLNAYARADDKRFDGHPDAINDPGVTVSSIEGTNVARVKQMLFPQAKELALPQLSDPGVMLMNVAMHKADVTFTDPLTAHKFMTSNPGQLRQVELKKPLRVLPNVLAVPRNEYALVRMLDNATEEMQDFGAVDSILESYEPPGGQVFWSIAPPYQRPN